MHVGGRQVSTSRLLIVALLSGLGLQLSFPPIGAVWLCPLAFVGLQWCVATSCSHLARLAAGFVAGSTWYSIVPLSLSMWDSYLIVGTWLTAGIMGTCAVYVAAAIGSRFWPYALPVAWACTEAIFGWLGVPFSVAGALALSMPEALAGARLCGSAIVSMLIVATGTAVWGVFSRRARPWVCTVPFLGIGALALASKLVPLDEGNTLTIAAIQPAIDAERYRAARWSLGIRLAIEEELDERTQEALSTGADLVVWPEGGNNLMNRRLPRRRHKLAMLTDDVPGALLVGEPDLTPDGRLFNTVSLVQRGRYLGAVRKSHLVPFAESHYIPGRRAGVLVTDRAAVGIAICYDSLHAAYVQKQVELGAEILVAVSNHASFGNMPLAEWHLAYSILRAVESGRALVFVANRGPIAFVLPDGRLKRVRWSGVVDRVETAALPIARGQALGGVHRASEGALLFFLVGLLFRDWALHRGLVYGKGAAQWRPLASGKARTP